MLTLSNYLHVLPLLSDVVISFNWGAGITGITEQLERIRGCNFSEVATLRYGPLVSSEHR